MNLDFFGCQKGIRMCVYIYIYICVCVSVMCLSVSVSVCVCVCARACVVFACWYRMRPTEHAFQTINVLQAKVRSSQT